MRTSKIGPDLRYLRGKIPLTILLTCCRDRREQKAAFLSVGKVNVVVLLSL